MKVLHISHHIGCIRDHAYIYHKLGIECEFWKFTPGVFMISKDLANQIWQEKKLYFNSFDYIVTSDTAPLSRIFMENIDEVKPKIVVWVCNRFDYHMESDWSFYQIFTEISKQHTDKFKIIPYSDFEGIYCSAKNVHNLLPTITPIGKNSINVNVVNNYAEDHGTFSDISDLTDKVFIPIYWNDNKFFKLNEILQRNEIQCYNGGYDDAKHLKHCLCMLTFPDAFSKLIAFETIQNEVIVFLPSEEYLIQLHPTNNNGHNYWFNHPFGHLNHESIKLCEWYRYKECRIYFDSIEDLINKIKCLNSDILEEKRKWCRFYAEKIESRNIELWKKIFI